MAPQQNREVSTMSVQSEIDKIKKLEGKRKSGPIIKLMDSRHADTEVIRAALESLANIADEDALNRITHYMEHESPAVRLAACQAGLKVGTEYMNTRVRYQLSTEQDAEVKTAIQEAFNAR